MLILINEKFGGNMSYFTMGKIELHDELIAVKALYESFLKNKSNLSMARGIPNQKMIDLTAAKFKDIDVYTSRIHKDGADLGTYNQGLISGIKEIKELFSDILSVDEKNLIIGGNSSLNLMFDMFSQLMIHGNCDSSLPWSKEEKIKFLCPVPGYDRHFAICEYMGIEMINIPMNADGPDMDLIEKLVANDNTIKGIWCVPLYSNPDGVIYSDDTIKRLAYMKTLAEDFRIFWDNAYCVHHLFNSGISEIPNILQLCEESGNNNRVYIFASTSKISMPGSGIAAIAASDDNIKDILNRMKYQTIGYDKLNMYRHAVAFPNKNAVIEHMKEVAEVLRPNFTVTLDTLNKELSGLDIAKWSSPHGGYFISFDMLKGSAKKVIALCNEAGVKLTPAGAPFPYHIDKNDSNIRIAPTYPSNDEMKTAAEIFCTCVKLSALESLTGEA